MRRRRSDTILTLGTVIGLALTVVTTIRGTIKAKEELERKEPQTTLEKIKVVAPCYIGSAVAVAGTLGCIVAKDRIHAKELAGATGLGMAAAKRLTKYRKRIKEEIGDEKEEKIYEEVVEDDFGISPALPYSPEPQKKYRFKDGESGVFFYSTIEQVTHAMYHLNRDLQARWEIPYERWFEFLGITVPEKFKEKSKTDGWAYEDFIECGYDFVWIDFYTNYVSKPKDGSEPYFELWFSVPPYQDYGED